jgi:hypothetical protein
MKQPLVVNNFMKSLTLTSAAIICVFFLGCDKTIRPISNSAYVGKETRHNRSPQPSLDPAFQYHGELSEFDVLGITPGAIASENEIRRALDNAKRVKLHSDSSLLLIQSGAAFPDGGMVTELSKHFQVVPFTGIPAGRETTPQSDTLYPQSYSRLLRLAAAKGGNDTIVCYWGILESETENLATKTVSWVPVVHWILPDQKQHMRIRLKLALIDVRTGNWTVFSPKPFEDATISRSPRREAVDQKQVEQLKTEAYEASAKDLVRLYSDVAMAQ